MSEPIQNDTNKADPIIVPSAVWQGIDAVRRSGLTNMLDRPVVARLAKGLGYPEAARWIKDHPKEFAEGIFRNFVVEQDETGLPVKD